MPSKLTDDAVSSAIQSSTLNWEETVTTETTWTLHIIPHRFTVTPKQIFNISALREFEFCAMMIQQFQFLDSDYLK